MKLKLYSLLIAIIVANSTLLHAQVINCAAPAGLTSTVTTASTVTLHWTATTGVSLFNLQYRAVTPANTAWTQQFSQTTTVTVSNLLCGQVYEWQVQSICGTSTNNVSNWVAGTVFTLLPCNTTCPAPSALTVANISSTGATFGWTAVVGVSGYHLQYKPVNSTISWTSATSGTNSLTLQNLTCGTTYEWQVQTVCNAGGSVNTFSPFVAGPVFTTIACSTPCPAPTALNVSNIAQTSATLSWTSSSSNIAFVVQYKPVNTPNTPWTTITGTSAPVQLSGLLCGTTYEWQVTAHCPNSNGTVVTSTTVAGPSFTTLACASTCPSPSVLTVSGITANGAILSWTAALGVSGYHLQYKPTNSTTGWSSVTSGTNSLTLQNLTCGTTYEWQVQSVCNAAGTLNSFSPFVSGLVFTTAACSTPCPAPTSLSVTNITQTSATLSWASSSNNIAFVVQYKPVNTPNTPWATITGTASPVQLSGLLCGTTYEWQVIAHCPNSNGSVVTSTTIAGFAFTTMACANTCPPPNALTVSGITANGAILSWNAATGVSGYHIQYKPTNSTIGWTSVTSGTNSLTLQNLTCGTTYEWQLQSVCNATGTLNSFSPFVAGPVFTTLPCNTPCPIPGGTHTTQITSSSAVAGWSAVQSAVMYQVRYRALSSVFPSNWLVISTQNLNQSLYNLACGTAYEWQVQTLCGNGSATNANPSGYSPSTVFTTLPCTTLCAAPTGLTSSVLSSGSATLSWNSTGAFNYHVRYRSVNSNTWLFAGSATNSVTINGLLASTGYVWQVQSACGNSNGTVVLSGWSVLSTLITPVLSPPFPNPAATELTIPVQLIEEGDVRVELRNSMGMLALEENRYLVNGDIYVKLSTGQLSGGLYFVYVHTAAGIQVHKVYIRN